MLGKFGVKGILETKRNKFERIVSRVYLKYASVQPLFINLSSNRGTASEISGGCRWCFNRNLHAKRRTKIRREEGEYPRSRDGPLARNEPSYRFHEIEILVRASILSFRNIRGKTLEHVRKTGGHRNGEKRSCQDSLSCKLVYSAGTRASSTLIDITARGN